MYQIVNPQQARLFDPFDPVLTEKTRTRLLDSWPGVFRHIILELMPGDTLAIFNRNRLYILYGESAANWNLKTFSANSGGIEWTIQNLTDTMFLDDRGVTTFQAVNAYGDFSMNAISKKVKPIIDEKHYPFICPEF